MAHIRDLGADMDPPRDGPYKITVKRHGRRWYWTRDHLRDAQKVAGRAEGDLDDGRDPYDRYYLPARGARGQTLRQWSTTWLAAQDVEESVRAKTQRRLDADILPEFGHLALADGISRIAVQGWLTRVTNSRRPRTGRPPAPATVGSIWGIMAQMCASAYAEGLLERDPCAGLTPPRAAKRRDTRHALTPAEVVALAEEMARPRARHRNGGALTRPYATPAQVRAARLTLALAWTGCRWSEQGGLRCRPEDIQLMRRPAPAITVTDDTPIKTTGLRGGRYHGAPKSLAGERTIEIIQPVADLYAEQMAHGWAYVWGTRNGGPHHYEDYRKEFKRAAGALGHPEWTAHDLRHSHATWLKRCDRVAVQERLGHEPGDVTDVYTHVTAPDRAEILRVLLVAWHEGHGLADASAGAQ